MISMAKDIARSVDARALAVPNAEHTVVYAVAAQLGLLCATQRCGRQVLVQPWMKENVGFADDAVGSEERAFKPCDRRAAVAGDDSCGVKSRLLVTCVLDQRQPHNRLL